jgi:hypothetical protein
VAERKINVPKITGIILNLILVKISCEYEEYSLLECDAM